MKEDLPGKLWSGLVVCVSTRAWRLTPGRIYEVRDGALRFDTGELSRVDGTETTFENFCETFDSKFIEYKGERMI